MRQRHHPGASAAAPSTPDRELRRPLGWPLRWPLPALLVWALAWALFFGLRAAGVTLDLAAFVATLGGAAGAIAPLGATRWRRVFLVCGFPLSFAASSLGTALPAWTWLLPLALLAALYPLKAWRDAPLFPTPQGALRGLAEVAPLADGACIVDAGCGLGAGLLELRAAYPRARLRGIEWSRPLALLCAWRCKFAQIERADIWAADWSDCAMVYLFQRPESMARAAAKAARELRPGAWLVSLEFEIASRQAHAVLRCDDGRAVYVYANVRMGSGLAFCPLSPAELFPLRARGQKARPDPKPQT